MTEVEMQKQLMRLSTEVEEYAVKLISEQDFTAVQVSFIFASVGASLLEVRAGKDAAVKLLKKIAEDVERGVKPLPMQ
ncbi:hypothetical protein [Methylobacterium sp. Gmos1]